jgi:hypothetical protein
MADDASIYMRKLAYTLYSKNWHVMYMYMETHLAQFNLNTP